jgi:hypothetical protein
MNQRVHGTPDDGIGRKFIDGTGQRWRYGRVQPRLRIPERIPERPTKAMCAGVLRERIIENLTSVGPEQSVDIHELPQAIGAVRVLKQMNSDVKHLICRCQRIPGSAGNRNSGIEERSSIGPEAPRHGKNRVMHIQLQEKPRMPHRR